MKYSRQGVTIVSIIDSSHPRKDGTYPIRIRVTYFGKHRYYPTGVSLGELEWDTLSNTRNRELVAARKDIEMAEQMVRETVNALIEDDMFSLETLDRLLRRKSDNTLNAIFRKRIEELKLTDSIGNSGVYETTLKTIEKFAGEKIALDSITFAWLQRFENYMKASGLSTNTIAIRLRTLRAVYNYAQGCGLIRKGNSPFNDYKIRSGQGRKNALTAEHIKLIRDYDDGLETTRKYRDYWMFLFYCNGMNVADFIQLKYSDIIDDEIFFHRKKTRNTLRSLRDIRVVVNDHMWKIIKRWGNPVAPDNYIFPHLDGTESPERIKNKTQYLTRIINRRMAQISEKLGIPHVSTNVARHSFATILKNKGVNIAYISEALGHSDIKTTEIYLSSFDHESRKKMSDLLMDL